ncbi:FimV/HubP family polar landmark protein, partial [uncultured Vibrio sp.]|uniref:FimV/HubP family polar landmark protein n=1 Tax=uncultured Vibrio sp. TaxID=114054 RepID=UPI0025FF2A2E
MRQILKRLLLPLAIVAVTQTSIVSAESIRLKGPNGEVQTSPQFSEQIIRSQSGEPARFYGPTTSSDTLWRIASQVKPASNLTVQQTLLAIYKLNPRAFENQNIHSLIPGSNLRIPSLAQVRNVSTQEAVNVMAAHQAKLDGAITRPTATTPTSPVEPAAKPEPKQAPSTLVDNMTPKDDMKEMVDAKPTDKMSPSKSPRVELLENELELSESELMALEEKNHKLRLMLSEVQVEVDGLKDELGDENRIRSEVEKLLQEERDRLADQQMQKPALLDRILSNNLLVAAMAIIPGLLIGLVLILLIGRRSKKDEPVEQMATQQDVPQAPVTPPQTLDESIDDDLLLDDDLFGDNDDVDIALDDELDGDDKASAEDDVFAGLDDDDLDFNLEGEDGEDPFAGVGDNGDLEAELEDIDMSSNGISVNSDDKALGLEEMERALDDVSMDDGDEEAEFDLSDDGEMSQDDIEALLSGEDPTEDLLDNELDQSLLDDLLSEAVDDDDEDELDSLLGESAEDFNLDTEEPAGTSDSEIDDIFASVDSENDLDLGDAPLASDSEIDDLFAQIESQADLETLEQQSVDETALLDELLEEESIDVDADSTELLDELIDSSDDEPEANEIEEL